MTTAPQVIMMNATRLVLCVPSEWSAKSIVEFADREAACPTPGGWKVRVGSRRDPAPCGKENRCHVEVES